MFFCKSDANISRECLRVAPCVYVLKISCWPCKQQHFTPLYFICFIKLEEALARWPQARPLRKWRWVCVTRPTVSANGDIGAWNYSIWLYRWNIVLEMMVSRFSGNKSMNACKSWCVFIASIGGKAQMKTM